MSNYTSFQIGDNKEFAVNGVNDITIYFTKGSGYTSANDTATEKYFTHQHTCHRLDIRSDQTIQIISMNARIFTDPTTIIINAGHIEKFDAPILNNMVLRTTVAGQTNIKIRSR